MSFIHSIRFRFTLWYLVVLGTLLISFSAGAYFYLSHTLHQNFDTSLKVRAAELASTRNIFSIVEQGELEEDIGEVVSIYFRSSDELVQLSARGSNVPYDTEMVQKAIGGTSSFATIETADGEQLRLCAVPFTPPGLAPTQGGSPPTLGGPAPNAADIQSAALVVGRPTGDIEQALNGLVRTLVIAVPLMLVLAGGGGVFLATRALKPVDKIARTAQEIEEADLSRRIEVHSKDELGRLAATLNQMIERLEKAFKRQQQFTSDASHELRTPLAVIQAESTLTLQKERSASDYQQSLETISQEAARMSTLIDQLLTLARADSGKEQLTFEEVELGELLRELSLEVEILCREKGLNFQFGQLDNLVVRGDKARLGQLFLNLLDNAMKYTPSGGSISVSLREEGQMAVVAITDTGIGIAPEDILFVFERFYRADKARSRADGGAGLGLAICRHIAEVHGGKIEVESQVGKGSTFSVFLPRYR